MPANVLDVDPFLTWSSELRTEVVRESGLCRAGASWAAGPGLVSCPLPVYTSLGASGSLPPVTGAPSPHRARLLRPRGSSESPSSSLPPAPAREKAEAAGWGGPGSDHRVGVAVGRGGKAGRSDSDTPVAPSVRPRQRPLCWGRLGRARCLGAGVLIRSGEAARGREAPAGHTRLDWPLDGRAGAWHPVGAQEILARWFLGVGERGVGWVCPPVTDRQD